MATLRVHLETADGDVIDVEADYVQPLDNGGYPLMSKTSSLSRPDEQSAVFPVHAVRAIVRQDSA